MAQTMREFAALGASVTYVGTRRPFAFSFLDANGVRFHLAASLNGGVIREDGAIRSSDVLHVTRLAEAILLGAHDSIENGRTTVVWGCYLYPYGLAALLARSILHARGQAAHLWLTPTGSDIWEIGPQLQSVSEWMLNSPLVDAVTAYSDRFAYEITARYKLTRRVTTIPPSLDWRRFEALDYASRSNARRCLEIPNDGFVIVCHSNMRPVKRPEHVIATADLLARKAERPITLLMIGPQHIGLSQDALGLACDVRWLGVRERVEEIIVAGDVELNCSTHDSYNLSLAEAMCCGLPVITTDAVGITPEIIRARAGYVFPVHSDCGMNFDCSVCRKVVEVLKHLCDNERERMAAARRAREWASATFQARSSAAEFLKLLQAMSEAGTSPAPA